MKFQSFVILSICAVCFYLFGQAGSTNAFQSRVDRRNYIDSNSTDNQLRPFLQRTHKAGFAELAIVNSDNFSALTDELLQAFNNEYFSNGNAGDSPLNLELVQRSFTSSDGRANDEFGTSVAISGDTVVIGAPNHDVGSLCVGCSVEGSVYIFVRAETSWALQQKIGIEITNHSDNVRFGASVAISGDTILVGAPNTPESVPNCCVLNGAGRVYVYVRSGTSWGLQTSFTDAASGSKSFGWFVALSENLAAIGASDGKVIFFSRIGTTWAKGQTLTSFDSVSLYGSIAVLGSSSEAVGANSGQGAAYIYERVNGSWVSRQRLIAADGLAGDAFGASVSIFQDTVAVSAPRADMGTQLDQGAVYVFEKNVDTWNQSQKLTAIDGSATDQFGNQIRISESALVVGSWRSDFGMAVDKGAAYYFSKSESGWLQNSKLSLSTGLTGDRFGFAVGVSGATAIAGVPMFDVGSKVNQGTGIVFQPKIPLSIDGSVKLGTSALPMVELSLSGGQSSNASSDQNGQYTFTSVLSDNNYTITPSKDGYVFTPTSRSYSPLIANQTAQDFTATVCTYGLGTTESALLSASGASSSFSVTATPTGCRWVSSSNASWVSITSGATGTGNGTVAYSVAPNLGPPRSGTITAAGRTFTVNQANGCSFSLSPTSTTIGASGGSSSFNVVASAETCSWSAVSNSSWVTLTGATSGVGSGTVSIAVGENVGPQRSGTLTVGGRTFTVNQSNGCTYSISPESISSLASASTGSVSVTSSASTCGWTATSNSSWVSVTSGASGNGNGSVGYSISANVGPIRNGSLTIAGRTFAISQDNGCTYSISPLSATATAGGGSGTVALTTSASSCAWQAVSQASWFTVTSASEGAGSSNILYSAAPNLGPARTATISVGDQVFTLNQSNGCTYSLTPTSASVGSASSNTSFGISASNGSCPWTATSNATWLTITSATSGSGNGTVELAVAPNVGPSRTGTISVGGQTFTATQANGCTYTLGTSSANVGAGASTGSFSVTASASGCSWTASRNDSWITVTSGATGSGSRTVGFSVTANTGPARTGSITAGTQIFTINQANGCVYSISPTSANVSSVSGSGSISLTVGAGCPWTAVSNDSFISTSSSGTGSGSIPYSFNTNTQAATPRSGTISVGGRTFTLNQSGCSVSLNPTSISNVSSSGGTNSFSVNASGGCEWTATSNAEWVNVNSGNQGVDNGTVGFAVLANVGPSRTGTVAVGGQTFTVNQLNGCTFNVSPSSPQTVAHTAGNLLVTVTASSQQCQWTSSSSSSWITFSSGSSGTGDGASVLSIAANTGPPRTGNVTIAGNSYSINQLSNCSYSLSSSSTSSGASGTSGSFSINTVPGCTWNATSSAPWITVTTGQSGSGSGNVEFSVSANTGLLRTGLLIAADQTFTVTQANGCSAVFSPTSTSFPFSGGVGGFSLTINSECPWTASSPDDWITVTSGTGTGNGSVAFQVSSNSGGSRSGIISVGSTTFTVNQAASPTGSVAGRVLYFFGQNPVAVPGVTLSALGSRNLSATTGSSGIFNIENFGSGAYTLTPTKTGGAGSAISATDASSVAQYSVGLIQLTPNQTIAADVSGDGTVSALDASRIAQFSVGLTLPSGDLTGSWKFTPSSRSYTSVTEALTGQDFTAILMGDVTGNWAPPPSLVRQSVAVSEQLSLVSAFGFSLSPIELTKPGIRSKWTDFGGKKNIGGDVIEIPISIADAMGILAYDAVITYDSDILEPVIDRPIESNGTLSTNFHVVVNRSEPGKIRLAAYGIAPVTGNGDLLVLRFRVKKPGAKVEDAKLRFESLMINEKSMIAPGRNRK